MGLRYARFRRAEALLKCLQNIFLVGGMMDSRSCQKEANYFLILSRSDITTLLAREYSRFSVMASRNVSSSHLSRIALAMGSNEGRLYSLAMKLLTILPTNYNFFKASLTTGIEIYIFLASFILFELVTEFDYRLTVVSPTNRLANVLFAHIKVVSPTY